jgi:hypothetical protein
MPVSFLLDFDSVIGRPHTAVDGKSRPVASNDGSGRTNHRTVLGELESVSGGRAETDRRDPMPDKQSRAEASFKRKESDKGGLPEHQAANQAIRDKTARLRALRLAKEAADMLEAETVPRRGVTRSVKPKA